MPGPNKKPITKRFCALTLEKYQYDWLEKWARAAGFLVSEHSYGREGQRGNVSKMVRQLVEQEAERRGEKKWDT